MLNIIYFKGVHIMAYLVNQIKLVLDTRVYHCKKFALEIPQVSSYNLCFDVLHMLS